ncbi:hypothetical protein KHA80_17545 [Anaerobacillus sp. HL2]|nr:hypothetical protein KHA80_17545 [Anaerobacillus sp. HL2]
MDGVIKRWKAISFLSNSLHIKGKMVYRKELHFLMDITERIEAEAKLSNYTVKLEEKQKELAAAYEDIKQNIEKAHFSSKTIFLQVFQLFKVFHCMHFTLLPSISAVIIIT